MTTIAFAQGHNALGLGDYEAAGRFGEQGLALCRETDNLNFALETLAVLGLAALHQGQYHCAAGHFTEAVATAQAGEQTADLAWLQSYLALAHLRLGQDAQAETLSADSVAMLETPPLVRMERVVEGFDDVSLGRISRWSIARTSGKESRKHHNPEHQWSVYPHLYVSPLTRI